MIALKIAASVLATITTHSPQSISLISKGSVNEAKIGMNSTFDIPFRQNFMKIIIDFLLEDI